MYGMCVYVHVYVHICLCVYLCLCEYISCMCEYMGKPDKSIGFPRTGVKVNCELPAVGAWNQIQVLLKSMTHHLSYPSELEL